MLNAIDRLDNVLGTVMSYIAFVVIAVVMIVVLSACGGSVSTDPAPTTYEMDAGEYSACSALYGANPEGWPDNFPGIPNACGSAKDAVLDGAQITVNW